jgi:O-antigen ligase
MYLLDSWPKYLVLFMLIVALINSRRRLTAVVVALALASTVAAVIAMVAGPAAETRLSVETGSLSDPNLLGMRLLMGLLFWMAVIGDRSRILLTRLGAGLCTIPALVALPLTGSRGALVGVVAVVAYLLKRVSAGAKAGLVIAAGVVAAVGISFIPEDLLVRYSTIADPGQLDSTLSREGRVHLFEQGVLLVARNPILGVGKGQFAFAENTLAIEQGLPRGAWHTVHNMYMEVASEAGIPALIVYMMILLTVWKTLGQLEKLKHEEHPGAAQIVRLGFWIKVAFAAYCTCGLFLSIAVGHEFILLVGLTVAFERVVRAELGQLEGEKPGEPVAQPAAPRLASKLDEPVGVLRGQM